MSEQEDHPQQISGTPANSTSAIEAAPTPEAPIPAASSSSSTEEKRLTASLTAMKPSHRFSLLAASVAAAAALGAVIGSAVTSGFATQSTAVSIDPSQALQGSVAQLGKEVAALKAGVEAASRTATAQFGKINERMDRSERAQADALGKIAGLSEAVLRQEKGISSNQAAEVTGSVTDARAGANDSAKPAILEGWALRDVYRGRALVENRTGLYEIAPGANLPGAGRIEAISQQSGRWVVVTSKGLIVSSR